MKNEILFLDRTLENRAEQVVQGSILYLSEKQSRSR